MPCYFVMDGVKQEMDEEVFDQMMHDLHQLKSTNPPTPTTTPTNNRRTRWNEDGTYNKKPLDPNYFNKYYEKHLKTPFSCPDCGRTISSKSNLAKHRQTNVCKRHQTPP